MSSKQINCTRIPPHQFFQLKKLLGLTKDLHFHDSETQLCLVTLLLHDFVLSVGQQLFANKYWIWHGSFQDSDELQITSFNSTILWSMGVDVRKYLGATSKTPVHNEPTWSSERHLSSLLQTYCFPARLLFVWKWSRWWPICRQFLSLSFQTCFTFTSWTYCTTYNKRICSRHQWSTVQYRAKRTLQ
jgi:hypothetical protein